MFSKLILHYSNTKAFHEITFSPPKIKCNCYRLPKASLILVFRIDSLERDEISWKRLITYTQQSTTLWFDSP